MMNDMQDMLSTSKTEICLKRGETAVHALVIHMQQPPIVLPRSAMNCLVIFICWCGRFATQLTQVLNVSPHPQEYSIFDLLRCISLVFMISSRCLTHLNTKESLSSRAQVIKFWAKSDGASRIGVAYWKTYFRQPLPWFRRSMNVLS